MIKNNWWKRQAFRCSVFNPYFSFSWFVYSKCTLECCKSFQKFEKKNGVSIHVPDVPIQKDEKKKLKERVEVLVVVKNVKKKKTKDEFDTWFPDFRGFKIKRPLKYHRQEPVGISGTGATEGQEWSGGLHPVGNTVFIGTTFTMRLRWLY